MQQESTKKVMKPTKPLHYAVGMFGTSIPINMFKTYALAFYVDKLSAITAKQFALILAIYAFIDAIDNPVYGFLSDCTRSKWGRRRPWLVIGTPLLVLCFIMFFNVPASISGGSVFWYALVMYILTGTLDSLINSNYGALFPEIFPTEEARAKTNAMRQAFQLMAMVISIALTPMVTDAIGYTNTSYIYGALAAVVILFMTFNSHEDPAAMDRPRPKLFQSVWHILKNPNFWTYGLTNGAYFAGQAVLLSAVPLFAKYALSLDGMGATIMQGVVIITAIICIPLWVKIIKKTGLMKAWRMSLLILCIGLVPLYFAFNLISATLILVIFAFGIAGISTTMDIVGARLLDEDRMLHGVKREGMFSSFVGILNKTSGLFTALGVLLASNLFGYINGGEPGPRPDAASRFLMVIFPFCAILLAFGLSFLLRFKDKQKGDAAQPLEPAAGAQ